MPLRLYLLRCYVVNLLSLEAPGKAFPGNSPGQVGRVSRDDPKSQAAALERVSPLVFADLSRIREPDRAEPGLHSPAGIRNA
jgi:hypothetical protein